MRLPPVVFAQLAMHVGWEALFGQLQTGHGATVEFEVEFDVVLLVLSFTGAGQGMPVRLPPEVEFEVELEVGPEPELEFEEFFGAVVLPVLPACPQLAMHVGLVALLGQFHTGHGDTVVLELVFELEFEAESGVEVFEEFAARREGGRSFGRTTPLLKKSSSAGTSLGIARATQQQAKNPTMIACILLPNA